jgi:class 3 adenylate cyclase
MGINPDRVLNSHATWVFVKEEIPCVPKGEITAKGARDPVKVYEAESGQPAMRSAIP